MKKRYILFIVTMIPLLFGCGTQKSEDISANNQEPDQTSSQVGHASLAIHDAIGGESPSKSDDKSKEITFVEDPCDEWTNTLRETGSLNADLNQDGIEDDIQIEYVEKEGTLYIDRFALSLGECRHSFVIDEIDAYIASFQKIELIDLDHDNIDELLLLFDTHGGGGEGTHDLYTLWFHEDGIVAQKMSTEDMIFSMPGEAWNIDDIYDIDKVELEGEEKLLARQYVWGEEGHADQEGTLVSILSYNAKSNQFEIEKCWMGTAY